MINSTNQFMGFDGFIWFQGVVESREDPLYLGRMKVRILGIHSENKSDLPTADLPWAYPVMPITSASMNGIGQAPLGVVEGTWVIGFFRDGENCQEPMVFGTIGGIPNKPANTSQGFNDPRGIYPDTNYLGEPDTNRLARNNNTSQMLDTIVKEKKIKRKTGVETALNADNSWNEPYTEFNSKYPFNHVYESESGHIKEYDDTKHNERISEYHRKGTFYEIYPDGKKVTKVVNDNYSIVIGNDYTFIDGVCNLTVNGDLNLLAIKDINIESNRNTNIRCLNATIAVTGDTKLNLSGDLTASVGGSTTLVSTGNIDISTTGENSTIGVNALGVNSAVSVSGNSISVTSSTSIAVQSGGFLTVTALGDMTIKSGGVLTLQGQSVTVSGGTLGVDITAGIGGIGLWSDGAIGLWSPIMISNHAPVVSRPARLTFDISAF